MADIAFSDGTTAATDAECLQQMSYNAKDAFVTLISGGSYPNIDAIREADAVDGKWSGIAQDDPTAMGMFILRFRIAEAVASADKQILQMLRWIAIQQHGRPIDDDEKVLMSSHYAQDWANVVEPLLATV